MMSRSTRESFMTRLHKPLGRTATIKEIPTPPEVDESIARLVQQDADLFGIFCERAAATGMKVHKVTQDTLHSAMSIRLREENAHTVGISMTNPKVMENAVTRAGFDIQDWQNTPGKEGLDAQFDLDAGITDVHAAIAETGSLICQSGANHTRGMSLIVPWHLAIVNKSQIMADLIDFWNDRSALSSHQMPASIAIITGPSKTADIEGVLITGVHGPAKVDVFVVEDL
jgi:L-lactate dehydrogenase complex protein LldG